MKGKNSATFVMIFLKPSSTILDRSIQRGELEIHTWGGGEEEEGGMGYQGNIPRKEGGGKDVKEGRTQKKGGRKGIKKGEKEGYQGRISKKGMKEGYPG